MVCSQNLKIERKHIFCAQKVNMVPGDGTKTWEVSYDSCTCILTSRGKKHEFFCKSDMSDRTLH